MTSRILAILLTTILLLCQSAFAQKIQFSSGDKQVALIELYTSQGCSSCPPADEWISELQNEQGLWSEFVPVAFHVNYWDYIGWKDRFSTQEYSDRHRMHKHQGHTNIVYTPGFFLNGKEWKSRFGRNTPSQSDQYAGIINATLEQNILKVNYEATNLTNKNTLNVAILGFGYQTPVNAGENSNRVLNEDFVLLSHLKQAGGAANTWEVKLPQQVQPSAEKYAIALWINQGIDLTPLQATGEWLPEGYFK